MSNSKYIFSFLILISTYSANSQIFSEFDAGFEDLAGQVDWLDIDSDGDLDLLQRENGSSNPNFLYINEGGNTFTKVEGLFGDRMIIVDYKDFNGDGYVDFLISKGSFSSEGITAIYLNKFSENGLIELEVTLNDFGGDGHMIDFDNDGDLDVIFSGQKLVQGRNGGWFFKTAIYLNDDGFFTEHEFDDNPYGFYTQSILPIDYDLDGQSEIVLTGAYEDIVEGRVTNSETRFYRNNGNFLEKEVLDTLGLTNGNGNLQVFDINGDGFPEISMTGEYRLQTSPTSFRKESLTRFYTNQNGNGFSFDDSNPIDPTIFGYHSIGDFDNNGFSDVAIIGNIFQDNSDVRFGKVYSNDNGSFTEVTGENLPGIASGSIKWGDFDNDLDLDLAISGTYESTFETKTTLIFINQGTLTNSAPTTPTNLIAELVDDRFEISWSPSTDSETNSETLTYNWYLRTETDTVISSNSFSSGKRKIVENGNLGYGSTHFLNRFMEPGDYYWSVQAIDNGFQGSSFSEESFFHVNFPPVINSITKSSQLEETPFDIIFDDISVTDPDSSFPDDFSIIIQGGANYIFSGNTITPLKDFFGDITIPVIVKDQLDESNTYELTVTIENVNDVPEITNQIIELSTEEDTPINVSLDAVSVTNLDVPFPSGFSLEILEGDNYSFESNLLTPDVDFNGTLEVPIQVNDGEDNSPIFNLEIIVTPVNDIPEIVSQVDLSTHEEAPITISLTDISVSNIDGVYPDDFSMTLYEGTNYTLNNLDVTPDVDFNGILEIPLTVNDGQDESNQFILEVEVAPVNDIPSITGTASTLTTPEGTPLTLTINDLIIDDPDNTFPDDFILTVFDGQNYSVSDNEITPVTDFVGVISVLISVSDGEDESDQTAIEIEVSKILSTMDGVSEHTFSIYPNPFANQLYIESGGRDNQFTIEITNLGGQKTIILEPAKIANYIDLNSIQDGIYLLKISDKGELILAQKIIKQSR